jgi:hypothetical protein
MREEGNGGLFSIRRIFERRREELQKQSPKICG